MVVTTTLTDGFMQEDLRTLGQWASVIPFEIGRWHTGRAHTGGLRGARIIASFVNLLIRNRVQAIVFWFVTVPLVPLMVVIAKALGRKVVVITGGSDAVYLPEMDWGAMKNRQHQRGFDLVMRLADAVLPFSESAKTAVLKRHVPAHIRVTYPGIDTQFFHPGSAPRAHRVVTCCYRYNNAKIVQKGLDVFVATARLLPSVEFVVIGNPVDAAAEQFQREAPPNVHFEARIAGRAAYRDYLQGSSIYAQLSAYEGFGVSLAEAMAAGCIPIVTDRHSLPEVVGDRGLIVAYRDVETTARAVQQALAAPDALRERARQQITSHFDRHFREQTFREELGRLVPALSQPVIRIELGCGNKAQPGVIGVDERRTSQTKAICDVRRACFKAGIADEVYSFCVLEHMDNPYELLDEVVRLLKPDGQAVLRVPNLGTYSAHLDMTHRFLADLALWRLILSGYFEEVHVVPVGTKYRDNRLLVTINNILVRVFRFYELAQGWTFICRQKRAQPVRTYTGWWQEGQ